MTADGEQPRTPEERDTLPLQSMEYYEQYRGHDRWDRVPRFFQRIGEAFGESGPRRP